MIHIQVDKEYWPFVNSSALRQAAKAAVNICGLPKDSDFTIVITGDEQVHALNAEYRKVDDSTDVLSFPADEKDPETGKGYVGDIIISYPRAAQQAAGVGQTTGAELSLLVIHGVLHLAGYDHAEVEEERVMFGLQNDALDHLNLTIRGFNS